MGCKCRPLKTSQIHWFQVTFINYKSDLLIKSFSQYINHKSRTKPTLDFNNICFLLQEREGLLKDLVKVENSLKTSRQPCYHPAAFVATIMAAVNKQLNASKVLQFSTIRDDVKDLPEAEHNVVLAVLNHMQTKVMLWFLSFTFDILCFVFVRYNCNILEENFDFC